MKKSQTGFRDDIWPDEQSVIESPHRLQYVRRLVRPEGCVFCVAAQAKKSYDSLVLFRDRKMMIVLNKYPYNNGHLLILPRRHVADYDKLSDQDVGKMQILMKHSLKILKKLYKPHGFNMGMNLGKVAGAGIPEHLHMHLIPRWRGDTNFFPLIAKTKLVVETTEQSYNFLRPHFEKLEKKSVI